MNYSYQESCLWKGLEPSYIEYDQSIKLFFFHYISLYKASFHLRRIFPRYKLTVPSKTYKCTWEWLFSVFPWLFSIRFSTEKPFWQRKEKMKKEILSLSLSFSLFAHTYGWDDCTLHRNSWIYNILLQTLFLTTFV